MSQKFTLEDIRYLPSRDYADRTHKNVGSADAGGHHPSNDAIGGYYGIQWWEIFEDTNRAYYKVWCYDGVYRRRGPYKEDIPECEPSEFIDKGWANHSLKRAILR